MIENEPEAAQYLFDFCLAAGRATGPTSDKIEHIRDVVSFHFGQPYSRNCGANTQKMWKDSDGNYNIKKCQKYTATDSIRCHMHGSGGLEPVQ